MEASKRRKVFTDQWVVTSYFLVFYIFIIGEREREVDPRSGSTSSKFDFYISVIVGKKSVDVCCLLLFVVC